MNNLLAKSTFFQKMWRNCHQMDKRVTVIQSKFPRWWQGQASCSVKITQEWENRVKVCTAWKINKSIPAQNQQIWHTSTPGGDIRHQLRPSGHEKYQTWWRHVNINRKERNKMEKMCKLESQWSRVWSSNASHVNPSSKSYVPVYINTRFAFQLNHHLKYLLKRKTDFGAR